MTELAVRTVAPATTATPSSSLPFPRSKVHKSGYSRLDLQRADYIIIE
jgi:hypothetical protein